MIEQIPRVNLETPFREGKSSDLEENLVRAKDG